MYGSWKNLTHLDRAVIPERRMHAKGSGAYGAFTVTHDRPSSGIRPRAMGDAPKEIKLRHIGNWMKADTAYGQGVAKALGISMDEVPK